MNFKQDLPLLNALAVFEAAARTQSFTAAASELHIAQSAVSRHVSNLEQYFHLELFRRQGKRIELTSQGRRLADAVMIGLGHIRVVLNELRRETQAKIVTIACSYDFTYLWLMPRFGMLRTELPEHEIRLITSHRYADFDAEGVDLSIRFGQRSDWPDATCVRLFGEEAFPICSPAFLAAHPELSGGDAGALRKAPLLQAEQRGINWRAWFAREGQPPPTLKGPVFSSYHGVLYETLAGRGVALGWKHLLGDLLERGLLVRLTQHALESDSAYFAVHRAAAGSIADTLAARLASFVDRPGGPPLLIGPAA
jgi:LysR family transcriptional regulator, glycine cleavage system transcriptional activator